MTMARPATNWIKMTQSTQMMVNCSAKTTAAMGKNTHDHLFDGICKVGHNL